MASLDIKDFDRYRKRKQEEADDAFCRLLQQFFSWLEENSNLREKVRAKHIFKEKTNIDPDTKQDDIQRQFKYWFAFDYQTVIGSRMFDLFIRDQKHHLDTHVLQLGAVLMVVVLAPYEIVSVHDHHIVTTHLITNERVDISTKRTRFSISCNEQDIVFARTARVGFRDTFVSPPFLCRHEDKTKIIEVMEKEKKEQGMSSWRTYLKEDGITFFSHS